MNQKKHDHPGFLITSEQYNQFLSAIVASRELVNIIIEYEPAFCEPGWKNAKELVELRKALEPFGSKIEKDK